jgi:hypothetical protein
MRWINRRRRAVTLAGDRCRSPCFGTGHWDLRPADIAEIEQALPHVLQFDGRKQFRVSGEMMARITAAHLVEQLGRAGFVVMKKPPAAAHSAPAYGPEPIK